jgi:hypothetical protein
MKGGGLGIVMDTLSGGIPVPPSNSDEPDVEPGDSELVFIAAPEAGATPYPAPLTFLPPVDIVSNQSAGTPAQRASEGLPAAAVDPDSGAIYAVWDDSRFRKDGTNDAVLSVSANDGLTWSTPQRVNRGATDNHLDHYNVVVAVGDGGIVHVAYRTRDESGKGPLYAPVIHTYYQESGDGGKTWTNALRVDATPSNPYYGAFSRDGTFEGDYNQIASASGYTYIVRCQGAPASDRERRALTPNPDGSDTLVLTEKGKGHQHQSAWVALVRNT